MPAKSTLRHMLSTGEVVTRQTARDYTHVVVVRDERTHDHAANLSYLREVSEERFAHAVRYAEERANDLKTDGILSWHGSEPLAAKAAEAARKGGGWTHVRIETVNGGQR